MAPRVIWITAASQRCGTHWLYDLVAAHPDVRPATGELGHDGASFEDLLMRHSGLLTAYSDRVRAAWAPTWSTQEALAARLDIELGDALSRFVCSMSADGDATHVVTKSPSALGLANTSRLLPNHPVIALVRHPGDAVASLMASFGGSVERWARVWAAGAAEIHRAGRPAAGARPPLVVRYEDLLDDPGGQLERVFAHAGLDAASYDFEAADRLPVRGSARSAGRGGRRTPSWAPVDKAEGWRPAGDRSQLSPSAQRRVSYLTGEAAARLGYDTAGPSATASDRARDAAWAAGRAAKRLIGAGRAWRR